MNIELIPPALSALAGLPSLYAQCAAALAAQAQRIAERLAQIEGEISALLTRWEALEARATAR